MRSVLWKLATKQLKQTEWKKLAMHWGFNEKHIRAIEHQYTGNCQTISCGLLFTQNYFLFLTKRMYVFANKLSLGLFMMEHFKSLSVIIYSQHNTGLIYLQEI